MPRHPPSRLVLTTKKRSVSNALPGPIIPSHQPRPRPLVPSRSSAPKPSRVLSAGGVVAKPAACASPLSAWQTRIDVVARAATACRRSRRRCGPDAASRPQSSASGRGRSRNCVSTVPTEPAAASALTWPCARSYPRVPRRRFGRCMIRSFRHRRVSHSEQEDSRWRWRRSTTASTSRRCSTRARR